LAEKHSFRFVSLWATKSIAMGMSGVLMMQFTFYASDIVGLDIGIVGVIMLVSRLLDAAFGLIVGFVVDRTNTRLGKGRPFDLFMIPMWVCVVLLFSTPDFGQTGQIMYIFAFFSLTTVVFQSLLSGGEAAYLGRAVSDDQGRAKVTSGNGILVMIVCTIGSIILPQLMATWGTQPEGWRMIALVYAIPMCVLGMVRFFTIKEKPVLSEESSPSNEKIGVKESVGLIIRNKYIFILAPAALICNLALTISTIITTFYFSHIIGDLRMMSFTGMIGIVTPLILLLFPVAIRKLGGMNFVRVGLIFAIVGNLVRLINPTSLPLVIASQFIAMTGLTTFIMTQGYFLLQVIDYGAQKSGKRTEGLIAAVNGLHSKVGAGLASVIIGGLMGVAGYNAILSEQPDSAVNMIIALFTWIPAILCALILVTVHFYDLDKKLSIKSN